MVSNGNLKVLFLSHRPANIRQEFGGVEDVNREMEILGQKNPCSYTGMAFALRGDFLTLKAVDRPEALRQYDMIFCAVSSLEDTTLLTDFLRKNRRYFPEAILAGQSEASVMSHRMCSRNWRFQQAFREFCDLMDVFTTFTKTTIPYFQIFCPTSVQYLPFLYPAAWVRERLMGGEFPEKERVVMKAGYIHGRLLADGYADAAPAAQFVADRPDYQVAFLDYPRTRLEYLVETEADVGLVPRGLPLALRRLGLSVHRAQRKTRRALLGGDGPGETLNNSYPFACRGVRPEQILPLQRMPWRQFLGWWAKSSVAIDMDSSYCVGRNVADAIATGTPIIGNCSDYQEQLLPELKVGELDYGSALELMEKLQRDIPFRNAVLEAGWKRLEKVDFSTAPDRFREMYQIASANRARRISGGS